MSWKSMFLLSISLDLVSTTIITTKFSVAEECSVVPYPPYDTVLCSGRLQCFTLCAKSPECYNIAFEPATKKCNFYMYNNSCPTSHLYKVYAKSIGSLDSTTPVTDITFVERSTVNTTNNYSPLNRTTTPVFQTFNSSATTENLEKLTNIDVSTTFSQKTTVSTLQYFGPTTKNHEQITDSRTSRSSTNNPNTSTFLTKTQHSDNYLATTNSQNKEETTVETMQTSAITYPQVSTDVSLNCENGDYSTTYKTCICKSGYKGTLCNAHVTSCLDWFNNSVQTADQTDTYTNEIVLGTRYEVTVDPLQSGQCFKVDCELSKSKQDVKTYVLLNEKNDKSVLDKNWNELVYGFGFYGGYWVGLEHLHLLTISGNVDMSLTVTFSFGKKQTFYLFNLVVGNASSHYSMTYSKFSTSYDSDEKKYTVDLNGAMFSTKDKDNDAVRFFNCALVYRMAFWYKDSCLYPMTINSILLSNRL